MENNLIKMFQFVEQKRKVNTPFYIRLYYDDSLNALSVKRYLNLILGKSKINSNSMSYLGDGYEKEELIKNLVSTIIKLKKTDMITPILQKFNFEDKSSVSSFISLFFNICIEQKAYWLLEEFKKNNVDFNTVDVEELSQKNRKALIYDTDFLLKWWDLFPSKMVLNDYLDEFHLEVEHPGKYGDTEIKSGQDDRFLNYVFRPEKYKYQQEIANDSIGNIAITGNRFDLIEFIYSRTDLGQSGARKTYPDYFMSITYIYLEKIESLFDQTKTSYLIGFAHHLDDTIKWNEKRARRERAKSIQEMADKLRKVLDKLVNFLKEKRSTTLNFD